MLKLIDPDKRYLEQYKEAYLLSLERNVKRHNIGLINPDKNKADYDDKIVSVGFEHDFHCGDVFEWFRTESYWLIYLQDLDEVAYFRGEIRRCDYTINWLDEDGNEFIINVYEN